MIRSRAGRALLLLAAIAVTLYILTGLFLPSSRRLTFGVDRDNGKVRIVRQTVTFLPPHQFYTLQFDKRGEDAQRDGLVKILSKEGVPVTISYRVRFGIASDRLPDPRRLVSGGWNAWMGARIAEAVSAVTRQVPIEELLSPTSQFAARRDVLRRTVAAHLAQSGLRVTDFAIARMEPDREALLRYKRAELRRLARGVAGRVAVIAIDGADWELLSELSADGRIPNLRALILGGTTGSMQTIQPTVSPLVWTTVATGLPPDRHGVLDFIERGSNAPITSYSRRAPAVWDIAEAFGRPASVTNWWTAWPPQATSTAVVGVPSDFLPDAIYPADVTQRVRAVAIPENTVGYAQVRRFLNITPAEYEAGLASNNPADPVKLFRRTLAKTWNDHRAALEIYTQRRPLVTMISYDGADQVNHLFSPFHPPYRQGINTEAYRRYWPTVANYYSELDRLVGEWMNVLSDDTTVFVVSAHGYRWGKNRPMTPPSGSSSLSDHRNPGVFIAYGSHVEPSRAAHTLSIYDVVPTMLSILGLPKSEEMPGNTAQWALTGVTPVTSVRVVSYNEFFGSRPVGTSTRIDPRRYAQTLQAVGHLADPNRRQTPVMESGVAPQVTTIAPQQWASYAWYNNQGVTLKREGKVREAAEAFEKAIELNPNHPTGYLNLAMTLVDRQQFTAADELFIKAIEKGLANGEQWFADFAALYRERDMPSRAIGILYKGREMYPQSFIIATSLGSALAQASRYTEALPELERSLGMQPSSTVALNNLGIFYAKKKEYARALDFWNRSLAIDPRQPQIRTAATAAQGSL